MISTGSIRRIPVQNVDAVLLPGFVGTTLPGWVADRLRGGLAGVCLYGENVESLAQLQTLVWQIRQAKPDALVAIDEEGGDVTRLHYLDGSPYPGAALLGRIDDLDLTALVGRAVANDLTFVGVDLNLAPVGENGIGYQPEDHPETRPLEPHTAVRRSNT